MRSRLRGDIWTKRKEEHEEPPTFKEIVKGGGRTWPGTPPATKETAGAAGKTSRAERKKEKAVIPKYGNDLPEKVL